MGVLPISFGASDLLQMEIPRGSGSPFCLGKTALAALSNSLVTSLRTWTNNWSAWICPRICFCSPTLPVPQMLKMKTLNPWDAARQRPRRISQAEPLVDHSRCVPCARFATFQPEPDRPSSLKCRDDLIQKIVQVSKWFSSHLEWHANIKISRPCTASLQIHVTPSASSLQKPSRRR